ncbi:MAG TPA: alpha/beta hydrolase [Candidatus Dormibacteraeota bacterium]|jgi:pimeloyl-ACP methyl ester carboxylesterase|nr:alpha/beta hydrolase [Candidatus Dormibacteraeota bacterium]
MAGSRTTALLGATALGAAALAGVARAGRDQQRRLREDPEYLELSRRLVGRPRTVVSRDGTRLHAEVFGAETGPTLVLLHGWTCARRFWHPQIVELSRDFRVVAFDLRGHGDSGPGEFSTDALADDLSAVLAACLPAGERAVLMGHSMGAMAVLAWAERHPDEVERAAGAVLMNTGIGDLVVESRLLPIPRTLVRTRRLVGARMLTAPPIPFSLLAPISRRGVRFMCLGAAATPARVAFCCDVVLSCRPDTWVGWGRVLGRLDLGSAVERLTVPTLVMAGECDRLTPPSHARRLERSLPQPAGLVLVSGAGHMLPVEAADEVNRRVREFAGTRLRTAALPQR